MEMIAWIGSVAFALCALPQAIMCVKQRHARGLSWGLLGLWLIGEVCLSIYSVHLRNNALIFNYGSNAIMLGIILTYKVRDERETRNG